LVSGSGSGVRFSLYELLGATPVRLVESTDGGGAPRRLASKEYRFALRGVSSVRLPKDVSALSDVAGGVNGAAASAVLEDPRFRVPLRAEFGLRRLALLSPVVGADTGAAVGSSDVSVCVVRMSVRSPERPHLAPTIMSCSAEVFRGVEAIAEAIEAVWAEADPRAVRSPGGLSAVWLGGDLNRDTDGGKGRVSAICATYGLSVEFVDDASRHVRNVNERLAGSPPDVVIVWSGHAQGVEPAVTGFERATVEGDVVRLDEFEFEDALVELRWQLQELDGAGDADVVAVDAGMPSSGDERCYIKIGGSGVGDVMVEVPDCGHGQWASDCRRKAPRACKGVTVSAGVQPVALFRCSKCRKHRWRARF